ncbi:MAG: TetR/AcrR family transcriptional regulator, partial [Bacteroidales bacterium]|nr:TetR/AcrR family transcriptional regulator [Bacteroidales bacterium]
MSPRTEQQYERMRQHRREQLMETGLRLFAELGYENTSISLIAKEAGISKGLMYNYFESKEALLNEVVRQGIEEMLMPLGGEPRPFTSQDDLKWFVRTNLNELMGNQHHWKLYYQLLLQPAVSSRFDKLQREVSEPWMRFLIDYFNEQGHPDSRIRAFVFGALLNGIGLNLVMNPTYLE